MVEQLGRTALDPSYVALTKKYYEMLVSGRARERIGNPTAEIASTVEISESTDGPSVSKRARLDDKSSNSSDNRQSSTEGTDKSTLRASNLKSGNFVAPMEIKVSVVNGTVPHI